MDLGELGKALLEVSPYALFVGLAFLISYLMYKANVKTTESQFNKAIDTIKSAYENAYKKMK